jgi:hypothetical protein
LLIAPAARVVDAKIMFRVLVEILGGNSIVARRRFACQGDIALEYLMALPADLDVGAVALECLIGLRNSRLLSKRAVCVDAIADLVLISCHPYVGIDSAPSFAGPSAQLSDLFGWLRQQRSMREPKGSAALDHVGAARRSRRSRNLRHSYRQLPWLAEGRADALFWRPRLASRLRRAAGL